MWKQKRDKKYRFFEQYKDPLTNKTKTVSITMNDDKKKTAKQAQIILTNKINKIISQVKKAGIIHGVTFATLLAEYLNEESKRVRRSTYYNHKTMERTLLSIFPPESLVENITPLVISEKLENLMYGERKLSSGYVSKFKYFLHSIFEYAVEHSYTKSNPVDKVKINYASPVSSQQIQNKFLEDNEMKALLKYTYKRNRSYAQLFEWLYLTGMRFSEAAAIQKKNIISKNGKWYARVNGSMVVLRDKDAVGPNNYVKSSSAKTSAGNRDVLLSEGALNIAQKHCIGKKDDDFLFINSINGLPMRETAVNRYLHRVQERQHISKKLTTHIFRHTHVSKLAEMGVPLFVIKRRLGHMNSKVTELVYLHITNREENQLEQKLNQLATILLPSKNK